MVGLIKRMVGLLGFGVLISIHCAACSQNTIIITSRESDNTGNTDYTEITPDDSLEITAEIPKEFPETATRYKIELMDIQDDLAVKVLMNHLPDTKGTDALGTYYRYEGSPDFKEGIASIGKGDYQGNLIYYYIDTTDGSLQENSTKESYKDEISIKNDISNFLSFFPENEYLKLYPNQDLLFKSREEAEKEIEEKLSECGFCDITVRRMESRDFETLNTNYALFSERQEIYNEAYSREADIDEESYVFSNKDEEYVFWLDYIKNGIPFCIKAWTKLPEKSTVPEIKVTYSENGIKLINITNAYKVGEELEEVSVNSPQKALNVFINEYNKAIHFENTVLFDISLEYIVVHRDDVLTAKPAWIISTAVAKTDDLGFPYNEYMTYAIDAVTLTVQESGHD